MQKRDKSNFFGKLFKTLFFQILLSTFSSICSFLLFALGRKFKGKFKQKLPFNFMYISILFQKLKFDFMFILKKSINSFFFSSEKQK